MIKYHKRTHSFTYDKASAESNEMPSIDDVKKDKYGNIICRMLPFYNEKLILQASKHSGCIYFSIIAECGHYVSAPTLKDVFKNFVYDEYVDYPVYSPFVNMSYDEVLIKLDLLEALKSKE